MSSIYLTEPPTHGKVLLHTSFGDIDIELWSKECPKACRNFVQLAMEGYYDNTIFHRVIRKFMVQGGDPEGTGKGGESIYGKPFRDEIHTRIKFSHRGQVAMANENTPGTNHSQFFFTLDKAPHLDKKHTIFGKIGDVDTDRDDRPLDPPRLKSVEILLNPFDDIIPRDLAVGGKVGAVDASAGADAEGVAKKARKKKGKKNLKLLSFGEEAEEDEKELDAKPKGKGVKSAHDALDDEKLSKDIAYDLPDSLSRSDEAEHNGSAKDGSLRKAVKSAAEAAVMKKTSEVSDTRNVESNKQRNTSKKLSEENGRAKPSQLDSNDADEEHEEGTEEEQERDRSRHPEDFDDGDAFMQKMRQQMLNKKKALEKSSSSHANSSSKASSHHSHRNESSGRKRRSRGNESEDSLDSTGEDETRHPTRKGGRSKGGEPVSKAGKGDKEQEQEQQDEDETEREKARRKAIKERAKEYEALRAELKAKHRAAKIMTGDEREKYDAEHLHREMLSPLEQMRVKYKKRRKEAGTREDSTMDKLARFTSSIRTTKKRAVGEDRKPEEVEAYHGQVMEGKLYEGDEDADDAGDWFTGPLKFKRHIDDEYRKGSDGRKAEDYAVIDPLKEKDQQPKPGAPKEKPAYGERNREGTRGGGKGGRGGSDTTGRARGEGGERFSNGRRDRDREDRRRDKGRR